MTRCSRIVSAIFASGLIASGALPSRALAAAPTTLPAADVKRIESNAKEHIGDQPDTAPPVDRSLSAELTPEAVAKAERKVADWELERHKPYFGNTWTWSTLYAGLLAAADVTGDSKYVDAMKEVADQYQWKLGKRLEHADDHCIGQMYLELYFRQPEEKKIAATKSQFDQLIAANDGDKWTWCDALFMGPPVWARLYKATGDKKYLDYLDRNWWLTSEALYDPQEHLFYRDKKQLPKRDDAGRKVFWSRGNGWVMAGLARVLQYMPADYPDRAKFVKQIQEMSAKLVSLQDKNGLWHSSLLNPSDYPLAENSGSALILYGLAYGVNEKILDRATYEPAVKKGWKGMLGHIREDGRFDCVQQTGDAPAYYKPTASYNYGVGGFLLAGSEVYRMAKDEKGHSE